MCFWAGAAHRSTEAQQPEPSNWIVRSVLGRAKTRRSPTRLFRPHNRGIFRPIDNRDARLSTRLQPVCQRKSVVSGQAIDFRDSPEGFARRKFRRESRRIRIGSLDKGGAHEKFLHDPRARNWAKPRIAGKAWSVLTVGRRHQDPEAILELGLFRQAGFSSEGKVPISSIHTGSTGNLAQKIGLCVKIISLFLWNRDFDRGARQVRFL